MKKLIVIAAVHLLLLGSTDANAFFFFFLPGGVTGKIADAVTGAEGDNCVGAIAKVGDAININGVMMRVKSLSGTSGRCANPVFPIRALLEPAPSPSAASTEAARKLAAEEDAKRLATEQEARSRIAAEEAARLNAKLESDKALVAKQEAALHSQPSAALPTDLASKQVDFNFEATKSARILGCQAADIKVTGADGGSILYYVTCQDARQIKLSCDPTGLCLQRPQ